MKKSTHTHRLLLAGLWLLLSQFLFAQGQIEICNNNLDDDGDGYVDCYDPDCPCAPVYSCTDFAPDSITARLQWRSALKGYRAGVLPLVANLNPQTDDIPEIILIAEDINVGGSASYYIHIYRGDGANAGQPDQVQIVDGVEGEQSWTTHPVIGDLDGNGIPEMVVVNFKGRVLVYRDYTPGAPQAMQLWLTSDQPIAGPEFLARNKRPNLADLDGDGTPEIIAGNNVFQLNFSVPANPTLTRVVNGGITSPDGKFHDGFVYTDVFNVLAAADLLSVADCNGDPDCEGLEIAAGDRIYAVDLDPNDGDGLQMKPVRYLKDMTPQMTWGDGYTTVADVDLDGVPDVVVVSRRFQGFAETWGIYIWNKNGLVRFLPFPTRTGHAMPTIANVYDDRQRGFAKDLPEIILDVEDRLVCFNLNAATLNPAQPWWWEMPVSTPMSFTGACSVFDFNGDGLSEIVYRDQNDLRILSGSVYPYPPGVDVHRNWWKTTIGRVFGQTYPIVADADNDGSAEIITLGKDGPGSESQSFLRVYESAREPWVASRPFWHQFNYNMTFANDDLSIPAQQQKHWLEFPAPGSGNYPFNNTFTQVGPLSPAGQPLYPVPDAVVVLDSSYCEQQDLYLVLRVCNQGSAALLDSLPMQFYLSDPTTTAATQYGTPFFLPARVKVGTCAPWTVRLPLPPSGSLWAVLNDNGTVPAPFQLAAKLPMSYRPECDYTNNMIRINTTVFSGVLDLGPDTLLCTGATRILEVAPDFSRYRWQNGSTGDAFTAAGPGKYWVDAWDVCGNKFTDTLLLSAAPPLIDTQTISFLPGQSVMLDGQAYTLPGTVVLTKPAPGGCDSVITYTLVWSAAPENDPCDEKTIGCMKFEILAISQNAKKQKTYRMRVTNNCAGKLNYVTFQLPAGMTAKAPATGITYTSPAGRAYEVRNPNHAPTHSIRFKSVGDGISGGQSDIFEYTLPAQADMAFIHASARLEPQQFFETHLNVFGCTVEQSANRPENAAVRSTTAPAAEPASLWVFPNPASDVIFVEKPGDQPVQAAVVSATGYVYRTVLLEGTSTRLDVSGLPPGVWVVRTAEGEAVRFVRM